jgi:hypothetical protein
MNSTSLFGYVGKENNVIITYETTIPRFVRHEIQLSLNGTTFTPKLPEIGSTESGFISFGTV